MQGADRRESRSGRRLPGEGRIRAGTRFCCIYFGKQHSAFGGLEFNRNYRSWGAFALRYVQGSAVIHSGGATDGLSLNADELFSNEGALLGCDALDGLITPQPRCSGYVTFSFESVQPNFTVDLELRGKQGGDFGQSVAASPGDIVEVRVTYTNTGTTDLDHVVVQAEQIAHGHCPR